MPTRFNLPKPSKRPQPKPPIDLGEFDPDYEGWLVVVNPCVPLAINDIMAKMASESETTVAERMAAIESWVALAILEWNFIDNDGNPLPQPGDGGASQCPYPLIEPLSKAFAKAIRPSNPS